MPREGEMGFYESFNDEMEKAAAPREKERSFSRALSHSLLHSLGGLAGGAVGATPGALAVKFSKSKAGRLAGIIGAAAGGVGGLAGGGFLTRHLLREKGEKMRPGIVLTDVLGLPFFPASNLVGAGLMSGKIQYKDKK